MSGSGRSREPFAWSQAMAFGLGVLKLPPAVFWAMTPHELRAALIGHYGRRLPQAAPSRDDLASLMARFPDHLNTEKNHHDTEHTHSDL